MPSLGSSLPEKIARWKLLEASLRARLDEVPHLADAHGELVLLIERAEELQHRFEVTRAEWQEVSRERESVVVQGEEMRGRLTAAIHFVLGFKSERLRDFGLKPRRIPGRPRKAPLPPEAPAEETKRE